MSLSESETRRHLAVTTSVSQHELVKTVANKRGVSIDDAAQDLLQQGLDRFDNESRTVSPLILLEEYESKIRNGEELRNWLIRADRRIVMRTRLRAGEYECTASLFAGLLLAKELSYHAQ